MTHDRAQLRSTARAAVAQARPRPWSVTLFYLFLSLDAAALCLLAFLAAGFFSGRRVAPVWFLVCLLLALLTAALLLVLHAGYADYALRLRQTGSGGPADLLFAFFRGGEVITLQAMVLLRCTLWALGAELAARLILLFLHPAGAAAQALPWLLRAGLGGLALNRQMGYALALFSLLDHPELAPPDAVSASQKLMKGRRLRLLLLALSLLPWLLLALGLGGLPVAVWLLLQNAAPALPLLAGAAFPAWFPIFFALAGAAAAAPLLLWFLSYTEVALAGFYAACQAEAPDTFSHTRGGKRLK